jgi:hypothetical protein
MHPGKDENDVGLYSLNYSHGCGIAGAGSASGLYKEATDGRQAVLFYWEEEWQTNRYHRKRSMPS